MSDSNKDRRRYFERKGKSHFDGKLTPNQLSNGIRIPNGIGWVFVLVVLFISSYIIISSIRKNLGAFNGMSSDLRDTYFPKSPAVSDANSDQIKDAAYLAAKTFVTKAYPGAKSFSSRSQSPVRVTGGALYSVTLVVDGVNSFNAPIRQVMLVSETHAGDEWHLLSMEQSE